MAKVTSLDEFQCDALLEELWAIDSKCDKWFPDVVVKWVKQEAISLGVPECYISIPLLVLVSHLAQHSRVIVHEKHKEPFILYGVVVGRSGTNKSAALQCIEDILNKVKPGQLFDTGTIDGLMKTMHENDSCVLSVHDEFSNFIENLDKNNTGSGEKSRILSLYNGTTWSKRTKNSGCCTIEDPRFNLFAFTQPYYAVNFARNISNLADGFFPRFLFAVPDEVFVLSDDVDRAMASEESFVDMADVLKNIYERCKVGIDVQLSPEAKILYNEYHDNGVEYRRANRFEQHKVSVMSKAKGLSLRLGGVISLLRNGLSENKGNEDNLIEATDYKMALCLAKYSVEMAFVLIKKSEGGKSGKQRKAPVVKKGPVPEAANLTIEYFQGHIPLARKLLEPEFVLLNQITKNKMYPCIDGVSGTDVADKFLNGLVHLGLGRISPKSKSFKRFNPNSDD